MGPANDYDDQEHWFYHDPADVDARWDDNDVDDARCDECSTYGDWQCRVHGPAILAQQRSEWREWARRRDYRRPTALRLGLSEPGRDDDLTRALREVGEARRLRLAAMSGDPLAVRARSERSWPATHIRVRDHLADATRLP